MIFGNPIVCFWPQKYYCFGTCFPWIHRSYITPTAMEVAAWCCLIIIYLSPSIVWVTTNSKHHQSAPLRWIKIGARGNPYPARADLVFSLLLLFVFKIDLVCAIPKVCSLATLVHGLARRTEGSSANPMRLYASRTHTHAQLQSVIFNICTRPKFLCRIV